MEPGGQGRKFTRRLSTGTARADFSPHTTAPCCGPHPGVRETPSHNRCRCYTSTQHARPHIAASAFPGLPLRTTRNSTIARTHFREHPLQQLGQSHCQTGARQSATSLTLYPPQGLRCRSKELCHVGREAGTCLGLHLRCTSGGHQLACWCASVHGPSACRGQSAKGHKVNSNGRWGPGMASAVSPQHQQRGAARRVLLNSVCLCAQDVRECGSRFVSIHHSALCRPAFEQDKPLATRGVPWLATARPGCFPSD